MKSLKLFEDSKELHDVINEIEKNNRPQWIYISNMRMECYIRSSSGNVSALNSNQKKLKVNYIIPNIVIANIKITTESWRGKGKFKVFHRHMKDIAMKERKVLFIESIINEELKRWALENGYAITLGSCDTHPTCYNIETFENFKKNNKAYKKHKERLCNIKKELNMSNPL